MATFRRTANALMKAIRARYEAAEAACAAELARLIEASPPPGSSIKQEAWRDWYEYGFVVSLSGWFIHFQRQADRAGAIPVGRAHEVADVAVARDRRKSTGASQ
jgi:hypothetical protein